MLIPDSLHHLNSLGDSPSTRVLSNGRYTAVITAAGTGYSSWEEHRLTPWSGDRVEDQDGVVIYLRDLETGRFWSIGSRPIFPRGYYRAAWRPGVFRIARTEEGVEATLEVCVPPGSDGELRTLRLRNLSDRPRRIEVTTLVEVALHQAAAHGAHPAFSKLFLQTEFLAERGVLLARRRPRSGGDRHPWLLHAFLGEGEPEHETDRVRFLGRGGSRACPRALSRRLPLSGSVGNVLDPILSLRRVLNLAPKAEGRAASLLGVAPDLDAALALHGSLQDGETWVARFREAETAAVAEMDGLGVSAHEAEFIHALGGAVLYGHPALRADSSILARSHGSVSDLSRFGISSDRPFAVLRPGRGAVGSSRFGLLAAHRAWRNWRLPIDLVLLGDGMALPELEGAEGSPIVLSVSDLPDPVLDLLLAAARLVVDGPLPPPASPPQLEREDAVIPREAVLEPSSDADFPDGGGEAEEPLSFYNGWGGFAPGSGEYVIRIPPRGVPPGIPPRPWINVIANEQFGFLLSETGAGYTWSGNSREHRVTPWYNDPLLDPHGEALYLRDGETGALWSPFPGPRPGSGSYEMRHGLGYSRCRHRQDGLELETSVFVPRHAPIRITRIRATNRSDRSHRISLTSYARLDLTHPPGCGSRVITWFDPGSGAVLARNPLSGPFAERIVFGVPIVPDLDVSRSWTGDRCGFLGPAGSTADPAALREGAPLDGRVGPDLDPCIAHQVALEVPAGETAEVSFLLGEGDTGEEVQRLLARYRDAQAVEEALREVTEFWREGVSGLQVETPSPALDLLVNGWLPYQVLACRLWGRSALYQSGGAFGFRDQLQDAGAILPLWPEITRSQILLHAGHQFVEGDVLHWWHPPGGEGIRTRFGDDLLWLPFLTAFYIRSSGDRGILEEEIPYRSARSLEAGEDEVFLRPEVAEETGDLYEHCCRVLDRSLATGSHGLPLFGTGDWNDGMNRVGREGRGESVWLGQFLYLVLGDFLPLCEGRGEEQRARRYRGHREALRAALNDAGWDGEWYRRGFYDNGAPLGSKASDECRVDALAQAWSVLSGTAPPERAALAMEAVDRYLVSEEDRLIRLLTPPFENTPNDPGYIKGYVPGVRENGGQYTHAALWVACAFADLGRNDRVAPLLEMLSPVSHSRTAEEAAVYELEPYVMAADVYGVSPHVGRGGWSWYTGSAGWMYRAVVEFLLGMRMQDGERLVFRPCIPDGWPGFRIRYRVPGETTRYEVVALNPESLAREVMGATLDGRPLPLENGAVQVPLLHDGNLHRVEITLGGGAGRDR